MTLFYRFANASLTQRVLLYLVKQLRTHVDYVTVVFFNDFWLIRLKLGTNISSDYAKNCRVFFDEHGYPYQGCSSMQRAIDALDAGCDPTAVMNHHSIAIISHGDPQFEEIEHFRDMFVRGLGYCPPSLV